MDATITNLSTSRVYVPGPNMDLAATGDADNNDVKTWSDITIADLDGNVRIKELVIAGTIQVDVTQDPADAAVATTGTLSLQGLSSYAVASLPTGFPGRIAFAADGRAGVEGVGVGTGTMVVYSNASWRRVEDLAVVAA